MSTRRLSFRDNRERTLERSSAGGGASLRSSPQEPGSARIGTGRVRSGTGAPNAGRVRPRLVPVAIAAVAAALLAACSGEEERAGAEPQQQAGAGRPAIGLAAGPWSSSEANSNLVKVLLEEHLGYRVEIRPMPADEMWEAIASGAADASVSAWLPDTHAAYAEEHGDSVVDLGANVEGVRTGLVVPGVSVGRQTDASGTRVLPNMSVSSISQLPEYADRFGRRIIGIEPSAGIMASAREALQVYGLEGFYRLVEGNEDEMITSLENAIQHQTWVVVTGWRPHWAFGQWNLNFLDDPQNVFGSSEAIHTIVRSGLSSDHPRVHSLLERYRWSLAEIEQVMLWIERDNGVDPYAKALRWAETHPERVRAWLSE